jgi:hypothetical protein
VSLKRLSILATIDVLTFAASVSACDCITVCRLDVAVMHGSWATYVGRVTAAIPDTDGWHVRYQIRVDRMWKGRFRKELTVHAGGSEAACGYTMTVGETYLVVASAENETYGYCSCHPLWLSAEVREAIRQFDKDRGFPPLRLPEARSIKPSRQTNGPRGAVEQ